MLTAALIRQGYDSRDLRRLTNSGALIPLRRGAYLRQRADEPTIEQAHRQLIAATLPQLQPGAVLSHGSAAVVHGLPVWASAVERVHLTRDRTGGGIRRSLVHVHGSPLPSADVTIVVGMPVTTLARTVIDLGRTRPLVEAVAAGDRALTNGLSAPALRASAEGMTRWPGIRSAGRALALLDARSESPGESVSRVRMHEDGIPAPELQLQVRAPDGRLIGRSDFGWPAHLTLGEFDGQTKYNRLLKPGQSVQDVVLAEKQREDALRDLGWQVVRWVWADLYRPGVIRDRLLRAFARTR